MTGFGRKDLELPGKKVTIEIKSLNSKQLDLNLKLPSYYREKEFELRSLAVRELVRGKVDFSIYIDFANDERENLILAGGLLALMGAAMATLRRKFR